MGERRLTERELLERIDNSLARGLLQHAQILDELAALRRQVAKMIPDDEPD